MKIKCTKHVSLNQEQTFNMMHLGHREPGFSKPNTAL